MQEVPCAPGSQRAQLLGVRGRALLKPCTQKDSQKKTKKFMREGRRGFAEDIPRLKAAFCGGGLDFGCELRYSLPRQK